MLSNYTIEELKEELRSRGYNIVARVKDSLRHTRETYEGEKPKRNTFESRRKRMGGSIAKTDNDRNRIIQECFKKPIGKPRYKVYDLLS